MSNTHSQIYNLPSGFMEVLDRRQQAAARALQRQEGNQC
jgi:hypothetical protein